MARKTAIPSKQTDRVKELYNQEREALVVLAKAQKGVSSFWNRHATQLWKQAIRRCLAYALAVPSSELSPIARVRFPKVAQFLRGGLIHCYSIVDGDGPGGTNDPPPRRCITTLLEWVVTEATEAASVALPDSPRKLVLDMSSKLRRGKQREVVALYPNTCIVAAGYIAKYTTKATETATGGTLVKPIRSTSSLVRLPVLDRSRAIITAAWQPGAGPYDGGFKPWAHQFGYGAHAIPESHRDSVTFAALRAAGAAWNREEGTAGRVVVRSGLCDAGRGCTSPRMPR